MPTAFATSINGVITRDEWNALHHYTNRDRMKTAVLKYMTSMWTGSDAVVGQTHWKVI